MPAIDGALLDRLYGCIESPDAWSSVLDPLGQSLAARSAVIQVLSREGAMLRVHRNIRDSASHANRLLHDKYVNNPSNPRLNLQIVQRADRPIERDEECFSPGCPHLSELRKRLAQIGLGKNITASAKVGDTGEVSLILHRSVEDCRAFGGEDEAALLELLPHVQRAVTLGGLVTESRRQTQDLREIVSRLRLGVVVADAQGQIRWLNQTAEDMIARSPYVAIVNNRLCCTSREDASAFCLAIGAVLSDQANSAARPVAIGRSELRGPLIQCLVYPAARFADVNGTASEGGAVGILMTQPTQRRHISEDALCLFFALTPAEARLAAALYRGQSLNDFALAKGISPGTARIQLKQVFAKLGVQRQAELVARIGASVPAHVVGEAFAALDGAPEETCAHIPNGR